MYMRGASLELKTQHESMSLMNKFRDNQASKKSHSPVQNPSEMISSQNELNSSSCRDAIYMSHGIISSSSSKSIKKSRGGFSSTMKLNSITLFKTSTEQITPKSVNTSILPYKKVSNRRNALLTSDKGPDLPSNHS